MTRARGRWAGTLVMCSLATSCGAKTGLTVPCSVEVVTTKPEIVLVLDRSSSLVERTSDGMPLIDALKSATMRIVPLLDGAGAHGLILFPTIDDQACGGASSWTVPIGEHATDAISRAIQNMEAFGLTPTYSAVHLAGTELRARAATSPNRRRFIVLATDGGANCNRDIQPADCRCTSDPAGCAGRGGEVMCIDDRRLVSEIAQLRSDGIDTVVIGFKPEQESRLFVDFLRSLAVAGGSFGGEQTPYLSANLEAQIETVLLRALLEPSYCDLQLSNGAQRMPDALVSGSTRAERRVRNGDGWEVDSNRPEHIRLFGSLCRQAISERTLSWRGVWNQRCVMVP